MRLLAVGCVLLLSATLAAQTPADTRPSFAEWLAGVREEALSRGIRSETVELALTDIPEPLPVVLERDRSQAESVLPLETYINRRLTPTLIARGREMVKRHRDTLDRVEAEYGVPARIIAGIWGIESNFGGFSGSRPIVSALATLAFDPRRSGLFRRELFSALEILDRGDIEHQKMRGSWAGAMGQPQFMPSSYLSYAVDYNRDGRRDIWTTPDDVLASIANYLRGHGWKSGEPWLREVQVSKPVATRIASGVARRAGSCSARRDMTAALSLEQWESLGVRRTNGQALPNSGPHASLVAGTRRTFLVYDNYDALLEYNCAHAYALSVALLGDRLMSVPPGAARPAGRPARTQP